MTARTRPPFRADHVGSLLRPHSLLQAREDHATGRIPAAELRALEDDAIRAVVKLQEDVGLQGVTDGEFRRTDWVIDFKYQLGGVSKLDSVIKVPFEGEHGKVDWQFVEYRVDKLHLDRCIFGEDFKFLKSVAKATPKLTLPSPSMMHYPGGRGIDRKIYPDMEVFFDDLARVYAKEIDLLDKLGCTYLQLDDTSLAFLNDPKRRAMLGEGAEKQHLRYIELFNASIAGKPANMSICTHLCRGNYRSAWMAAGGYEHVADALFNGLNVDGFFLEYDDERSGGFEPLRFVPKGKMVVLGLVTTKKPALESKDLLKRRIEEASKFVPLDQICLSPQCGFASTSEGNELTIDDEIAKLRLVVETAREIWG
ncbi:MAG: 5-methyltetrahydropteroyltriglutamate--homocysteine S-methyltransferase [Bradyrhizobiaceae bacterium]|nr:5-methyltetrahydropteroyltriglutamate--homocysteine S-methyltransferase [Bradyrhizobiaceae bacterium]